MTTAGAPTSETSSLWKLSSKTLLVQKWWVLGGGREEGFAFLRSVYVDFFFLKRSYWKRILPHCNTFVRSNAVLQIQRSPSAPDMAIIPVPLPLFLFHCTAALPIPGYSNVAGTWHRGVLGLYTERICQNNVQKSPHWGFGAVKVKFPGPVVQNNGIEFRKIE